MSGEKKLRLKRPVLAVVSAPSGAGKSTLCGMLLREFSGFVYSISCTTRNPRGAEQNGVAYYFLTETDFAAKIAAGEFLENAVVHGHRYGTLRKTVEQAFAEGKSVIMDIDVVGAAQVREKVMELPENNPIRVGFTDIFFMAPSIDELRRRLCGRGEDTPDAIECRLKNAAGEIAEAGKFEYVIVNDNIKRAYGEFRSVIIAAGGGTEEL